MSDKVTIVHCPTCGAKVIWGAQSPYRPFCSERCRLIDLGEWVEGTNRAIPGQESPLSDDQDEEL